MTVPNLIEAAKHQHRKSADAPFNNFERLRLHHLLEALRSSVLKEQWEAGSGRSPDYRGVILEIEELIRLSKKDEPKWEDISVTYSMLKEAAVAIKWNDDPTWNDDERS